MPVNSEDLFPAERLAIAQNATSASGLDALLVGPGADLRYLTGYNAPALERLTCLVLPREGEVTLVVPTLERPAAEASPAARIGIRFIDYPDGTDPYPLVRDALRHLRVDAVGLSNRMWAEQVLALRHALPAVTQRLAGEVIAQLRITKSTAEITALRRAGRAIDAVHRQVGDFLRPGRSEAEIGVDIARAIRDAGHATADFVIVGSGPNGASPHHSVSERVIAPNDIVVVDIGGTMPDGYCSDCTRTYVVGDDVPAEFLDGYKVLQTAQQRATAAVRPGVSGEAVDAVARDLLTQAGYGPLFLHRTGHGIGLDGHEDPYIVTGNTAPLSAGMTFSIEPGIYWSGRFGARIEDIVVCTDDGAERLNTLPTDLVFL
jgi:Xaa-Pro aminopeptidase